MKKSKFDIFTVIAIYSVAILGPILLVYFYLISYETTDKFLIYFGLPLMGLALILLWIFELPKICFIQLTQTTIQILNPINKRTKSLDYNHIDGFKKQFQPSRFGINKSILIYQDDKVIHEISSLYIKNFDEIEGFLKTKINYLGTKKFRWFDHLIEEIKRKIGT